jgi:tRNA (guanine-N1)-methyltransferase
VPGALTPLSADAAGDVIAESYGAVTREEPTEQIVALLKAQSGFETGRWQSMHSHNFGNVTHTGAGPYWARTVTEFLPEPTVKRMRFRAYDSAPQGADDWIGLLERKYPQAWAVLQGSADPRSFVEALKAGRMGAQPRILLMTPQGRQFDQKMAEELAAENYVIILCGRYEGVDERIRQHLVTDEVSIGDYVLTGGELAALVVTDAVARLVPGVLGDETSPEFETFSSGLLEYPQYTRPADFRGHEVPEVLLSGDHARIEKCRREQALTRTLERRPDLLETAPLSDQDRRLHLCGRPDHQYCLTFIGSDSGRDQHHHHRD